MRQKKNKKRKPVSKPIKKKSNITLSSILGIIIGLVLMGIGLYFGIKKGQPGGYFIAVIGACFFTMVILVFYWRTKHS